MSRSRLKTRELDAEVGRRLATQRMLRGLSQSDIGNILGVTSQQIQKQESGANRIGVGAFLLVCREAKIDPHAIIDGLYGPSGHATQIMPTLSANGIRAAHIIEALPPPNQKLVLDAIEKLVAATEMCRVREETA